MHTPGHFQCVLMILWNRAQWRNAREELNGFVLIIVKRGIKMMDFSGMVELRRNLGVVLM